jgi:hypothetical protein
LYKKLKDGQVAKSTESYDKIVSKLGELSGLTKE